MSELGWIKVPRALLHEPYFQLAEKLQVYLYLYLKASHKARFQRVGQSVVALEAGQLVTGRRAIALDTGLSESAVRGALSSLEGFDAIRREALSNCSRISICAWAEEQAVTDVGTSGASCHRVIAADAGAKAEFGLNSSQASTSTSPASDQGITAPSPPAGQSLATNNNLNNVQNVRIPEQVREVFSAWQQIMGKPASKLTPAREKAVRERLAEGYTCDQIKQAITGCRSSPFHMGSNPRGEIYCDLELICRTPEKLEKFISYCNNPPKPEENHGQPISATQRAAQQVQTMRRSIASCESTGDIVGRGGEGVRLSVVEGARRFDRP